MLFILLCYIYHAICEIAKIVFLRKLRKILQYNNFRNFRNCDLLENQIVLFTKLCFFAIEIRTFAIFAIIEIFAIHFTTQPSAPSDPSLSVIQ